jgi:translocation and assembly module TamB
LLDQPISGRITANAAHVAVLEPFFPQLRDSDGRLSASIDISGRWREPRLTGNLKVGAGQALLRGLGLQLRNVNADIAFTGDSAVIRRFSAGYDEGGQGDTASLGGYVAFRDFANPSLNLEFFANGFRIAQLPRVAELYINSRLLLAGSYRNSALSGFVTVSRGAFYIPELSQKRLPALREIDSTLLGNREFTPPVPSEILRNLELRNVRVTMGDQVWLRSVENNANIQLGGSVSMTSVLVPRSTDSPHSLTLSGRDSVYRLALEGTLSADRGEYRLNVGVVQRKFQVEPGGTVRFLGEPELNPTLNISAVHSVRRVSGADAGRDIRIRVRLIGSLSDYQIGFESVDGLELSQSDLISYLVTGSPTFELGAAGNENLRAVYASLVPSLGALLGDQLAGSRFDLFTLDLAPLGETDRLGESLRDAFKRTRVGIGKQIGPRTFVTANTNLCQIGGLLEGQSATTEDLIQSIGVTLEQRLNNNFSMAFSAEPSTAATRCAAAGSRSRGLISSPPQFGFDLFKVWRF